MTNMRNGQTLFPGSESSPDVITLSSNFSNESNYILTHFINATFWMTRPILLKVD